MRSRSARTALALHDLEGDLERVGAAQRWLSRFSWFFGRGEDAQRYADQAIATLERLEPGAELAMAFSNKAQLAMLAGDEGRPSGGVAGPSGWPAHG